MLSVRNIRLVAAGRRATEQWPSDESALRLLVETLTELAEQESDPNKKSKLRKAAEGLAGITGDLATNIAAAYLARVSGIA